MGNDYLPWAPFRKWEALGDDYAGLVVVECSGQTVVDALGDEIGDAERMLLLAQRCVMKKDDGALLWPDPDTMREQAPWSMVQRAGLIAARISGLSVKGEASDAGNSQTGRSNNGP